MWWNIKKKITEDYNRCFLALSKEQYYYCLKVNFGEKWDNGLDKNALSYKLDIKKCFLILEKKCKKKKNFTKIKKK